MKTWTLAILLATVFPLTEVLALEIIAGFGDSITQGYPYITSPPNGARVGGYEPPLEDLMNNSGRSTHVLNYGQGGDVTWNGVNRIDSVLDDSEPDIVLVLMGTNDMPWVSAGTTISNLSTMLNKITANKAVGAIGTLTPDTHPDNGFKNIPALNNYIRNLAGDKGVNLADHYNAMIGNWGAYTTEGLHLNVSGNNKMAQTWFNAMPDRTRINGHLYLDRNGNGDQDSGEANLAKVDVVVTNSKGASQRIATNTNGNYTAIVSPGNTVVNIDENDPQFPKGAKQTEGDDPTTVNAKGGANTFAGNDGFAYSNIIPYLMLLLLDN